MSIRHILVHLARNGRQEAETELAMAVARRHEAKLTALYVMPPLQVPGYVLPYITEETRSEQENDSAAAATAAKSAFLAAAERRGVASEWRQADGDPRSVVLLHARYTDLVVVGQDDPDRPPVDGHDLAGELVLAAGRPVLTVPYAGRFKDVGGHVLVAWNGTRESTRAVHDALPILEKVEEVIVFSVNPPDQGHIAGAEICAHLAQHGVEAKAQHTVAPDLDVSDALLSSIADYGVDMLVMGAYGHSRFREFVLGGATRGIMRHMTVPVLMAH